MAADPRSPLFTRPPVQRRAMVKRGAVTATFDPLAFRWNDIPVPLSPIEAELLAALVRRSRMRWDEINATLIRLGCAVESRDVLIHRIRRKFALLGAADPIETLRGWGLRFRVERDAQGSHAFWIGGSAGDPVITL